MVTPVLIDVLAFSRDFATMSISTDRVLPSPEPDRWDVRSLALAGLGLGSMLLVSSAAVYWIATDVLRLSLAQTQTAIFLWLTAVDGQVTIYLTRSFFWTKPYPGRWVIAATLLVIGAAILLTIEGWLMAPLPPLLIAGLLLLAAAFFFVADLLKVALAHSSARIPHARD